MRASIGVCVCVLLLIATAASGAAVQPTSVAEAVIVPSPDGPGEAPRAAAGCPGCPPEAFLEGEPDCTDGFVDVTNGGCSGGAPLFVDLPCGSPMSVCGTYGGYCHADGCLIGAFRDTDWYRIVVTGDELPAAITWRATGESDMLVGVIDGTTGCSVLFTASNAAGTCSEALVNHTITAAGDWYLFVSTNTFGAAAGPCGQQYVATLEGHDCSPVPVERESWGRVKGSFRE